MRSYLSCLLLIVMAISFTYGQKQAPLWPQHFSIAYHFIGDSGKLNTTAKIWYDYNNQLFKTQYDNGMDSQCYYEFGKKTKCVELYRNKTIYLFSPQQSICCHYPQQKPPKRDFLRTLNFTYIGESSIDGQSFDLWQSPLYPQNKYYATKDTKQVPRRFALGSLIRDYLVNSFNNGQIASSVFVVPSYCKKECNGLFPTTKSLNNKLTSQ